VLPAWLAFVLINWFFLHPSQVEMQMHVLKISADNGKQCCEHSQLEMG